MDITDLLVNAQKNQASDLHLSADNPPLLRIHGEIVPFQETPLSAEDIKTMIYSIMTEQQRSDYERGNYFCVVANDVTLDDMAIADWSAVGDWEIATVPNSTTLTTRLPAPSSAKSFA